MPMVKYKDITISYTDEDDLVNIKKNIDNLEKEKKK